MWSATGKEEDRVPDNSSEQSESKDKKASRWGNSSPKSIVSEEENWDDDGERKNDGTSIVPLPQTEPIDDDSDVDFDEGATAAVTEQAVPNDISDAGGGNDNIDNVEDDEPQQQSVPLQQPVEVEQSQTNSFDIFDDSAETATSRPQETTAFNSCDDKTVDNNVDNHDEPAECNTTPLYDEPEEEKTSTEKVEQNDNGVSVESNEDEKKWQPELPDVPGIDN